MRLFLGVSRILIAVFFLVLGAHFILEQDRAIDTARTVPAVIQEKEIRFEYRNSSRTDLYSPVVKYSFRVNGQTLTGYRLYASHQHGTRKWAAQIIAPFAVGDSVRIYYDPDNPSRAFLFPVYDVIPYAFILCGLFLFGFLGWQIARYDVISPRTSVPFVAGVKRYGLRPLRSLKERRRAALMIALAWNGIGWPALAQYFGRAAHAEGAATLPPAVLQGVGNHLALPLTIAWGLACVIPTALYVYYWRMGREVEEAQVLTDSPHFATGENINVLVRQRVRESVSIQELTVTLVGKETTIRQRKSQTITLHRDVAVVLGESVTLTGDLLEATAKFAIPPHVLPSTPADSTGFPRVNWTIETLTRIARGPDYAASFPITVTRGQATAPQTPESA